MIATSLLFQGLLIGFLSSAHCIGMCGGLLHALNQIRPNSFGIWWHQLGRISTYFLLTILFASLINLNQSEQIVRITRTASAIFLIALGCYFLGWQKYQRWIETVTLPLWHRIRPFAQRFMQGYPYHQQYFAGILWGFIPCGLLYSIIPYAVTLGSLPASLYFMAGFAGATFTSLALNQLMLQKLLTIFHQRWFKMLSACTLFTFAAATLYQLYF